MLLFYLYSKPSFCMCFLEDLKSICVVTICSVFDWLKKISPWSCDHRLSKKDVLATCSVLSHDVKDYFLLYFIKNAYPILFLAWSVTFRIFPLYLKKRGILSMTLNCIQWWASSFEPQGNEEHPFVTITPMSTLTC